MKLLTVILNYKTPDLTLRAMRAALRATVAIPASRIVIVDNDSGDGSYETLASTVEADRLAPRVEVIASGRNGGFGFGNNVAIRRALASNDPPDYVYILNSDAFPKEDAIVRLVAELDAHPDVGIVGSFIHGVDGMPHETAFRFPSIVSELEGALRLGFVSRRLERYRVPIMPIPDDVTEVDWLAGASMMVRRAVFEEIGLFDETFFLYFEETDLCQRARRAGWKIVYVRDSHVAHIGSASTGMKNRDRPMPTYWFDSRRHYFLKNHGPAYLWAANAAHVVGATGDRLRRAIQGKPKQDPPRFLRDLVVHALRGSSGPRGSDSASAQSPDDPGSVLRRDGSTSSPATNRR